MYIQLYLDSYSYKKLSGSLVPDCKKCGCGRLRKDGKYKTYQQYKCRDCGFRFSHTSDLPRRRFNSKIINFAVDFYINFGVSLRKIARKIFKYFKTKVSHQSIKRWVKAFKKPEISMNTGNIWHADETAIRIKGGVYWLWLVIDRDTGGIISWHISKTRSLKNAKIVMRKAKQKAGTPEKIITDGLLEYIRAIRKVFGWRAKTHSRNVKGAYGPNCLIERTNKEVKRRIKWFGTFQSIGCAKIFFEQWVNNYNTEKVT